MMVVVALARQLLVCLLQQALLRQALSGSGDGEVRMVARFWARASLCSRR
jgi:hypothetical protein